MGETSANGAGSCGFVEASQESEWCAALKTRDCKNLLRFLRQQRGRWREIDSNGRTVLHVAVIQACSELVVEVLKSVNETTNTQSYRRMLVEARDKSLCNAGAYHLARIVGNKDIIARINRARTGEPPGPQARVITNRLCREVCGIINSTMRDAGIESRLEQQFEVDVDYNFVDKSKQWMFFLHVACKKADQWDFIREVISRTKAISKAHVQALFKLKDPQGRTLLHVAIEEDGFHHEELDTSMATVVNKALEILEPGLDAECVKNCVNAQDSAGRTPLHRAVANKHAGPEIIKTLVDHRMTDVNALWKSLDERVTGNVTALHLAVLHNNLDAAKVLLEKEETRGDIRCEHLFIEGSGIPKRDSTERKLSGTSWTALELATMMGQVHMVGTLLEVCS
jgi:ankyrin repeat protein